MTQHPETIGLHMTATRIRGHVYVALWDERHADELLDVLERWGADPEIDLLPCEAVHIGRAAMRSALRLEDERCEGK